MPDIPHYSAAPDEMTIDGLITWLQELRKHGTGNVPVTIYDPDTEQWEPITGGTDHGNVFQFYSDVP